VSIFIILSLLFLTILLWLYARYLRVPVVAEKHSLQRQVDSLKKQILAQTNIIASAQQTRSALSKAEHDEFAALLHHMQDDYINASLTVAFICDASDELSLSSIGKSIS